MFNILIDHLIVPILKTIMKNWGQLLATIISQKETSPLAHFVRNSLPHKSFRFCSPMQKTWGHQLHHHPPKKQK